MTQPTTILIDDRDDELEAMVKKSSDLRAFWTPEQERLLERYYGKVPTAALAKKVQKSPAAVYKKAGNMGIAFNR